MFTPRLDATHTYRGYRQQALYVLWRILSDTNELIFQPEGFEDLAIFSPDETLIEIAQVKAHTNNLTLSTFDPRDKIGFFNRVHNYLNIHSDIEVNIVSFGNFGDSFYQSLVDDDAERNQAAEQLSSYGNLTQIEAENVLTAIRPIRVSEQEIRDSIDAQLRDSLIGEPDSAFDMLSYWIYVCSERKQKITRQDVITKINQVGQFINARAAHHSEWFTTIVPIEDRAIDPEQQTILKERFYEGVSARYEHILADLDVPRPRKLQQIHEAFTNGKVVIVHGASGQGKTTLAFRYLHDYLPEQWRFFVHSPESRSQALSIANAISHHAQSMNVPLVVYLDVKPSDTDWTETVRELAFIPNIRILVTIREDDLRRASFSTIDFPYVTIELQLNADEAKEIYARFVSTKQPSDFPDFEAAWARFGVNNQGPLMEFIYLITQGASLRDRLEQQIKALEDQVATGKLDEHILQLLRLVTIASAFGARLQRQRLAQELSLKVPKRLFERLEKEYLIKIDDEQLLIDGVHPIRSLTIKSLLVDEYTSSEADIRLCLTCMYEPDLANFLLELFVREPAQIDIVVKALEDYYPHTWTGMAGITRALVWLGINHFVERNVAVHDKAYALFGGAATMLLNPDIAGVNPESRSLIDRLGELVKAPEAVESSKELESELQGIEELFTYAATWLEKLPSSPNEPDGISDWKGLAESVFWLHHLQINKEIDEWLIKIDFNNTIPHLPLDVLADISAALAHATGPSTWHTQYRPMLLNQFKRNTDTVSVQAVENGVNLHFVFDIQGDYSKDGVPDPIHHNALQRVRWFADLFPEFEMIGTQGYGHRIHSSLDTFDSSYKQVSREHLYQKWLIWVNSIYSGLFSWKYRPKNWKEYTEIVIDLREQITRLLVQYERSIEKYFQRKNPVNLHSKLVSPNREFLNSLRKYPSLPRSAVDPWGFTKESSSNNQSVGLIYEPKGVITEKFGSYSKAIRSYFSNLTNFFTQSPHALVITEKRRVFSDNERKRFYEAASSHGIEERLVRLSVVNLFEAWNALPDFQREFHDLLYPFVDQTTLLRLERQEQQVYQRLWSLWYFFAFEPYHVEKNAGSSFSSEFRKQVEDYIVELEAKISDEISGDIALRTLTTRLTWEHNSTLTVLVDSADGWNLYQEINSKLRSILSDVFQSVQLWSASYYAIRLAMQRLLIVPLINGRLLNKTGYHIPTVTLLSSRELHQINFSLQPLPGEIVDQLEQHGVLLHDSEEIGLMRQLLEETANTHAIVSHLNDLVSIPDIEDEDAESLQAYIDRTFVKLSDIINQALAYFAETESIIATFSFSDSHNQELANEMLGILRANLLSDDIDNDGRIQLGKLGEWRNQLVNALGAAFALCTVIASEMR